MYSDGSGAREKINTKIQWITLRNCLWAYLIFGIGALYTLIFLKDKFDIVSLPLKEQIEL